MSASKLTARVLQSAIALVFVVALAGLAAPTTATANDSLVAADSVSIAAQATSSSAKKPKNDIVKMSSKILVTKRQHKLGDVNYTIPVKMKGRANVTCRLVSIPKQVKRYVKLSKAGVLTVKKGLQNGRYPLKVKVITAATEDYRATSSTMAFTLVYKGKMATYPSLDELGVSGYSSSLNSKLDNLMDDINATLYSRGVNYMKLKPLERAHLITSYVGSQYSYADGSYTAESMIDTGSGTCFAYSELTYCLAKKSGLANTWLTEPGRNVNHGGKFYGSLHRSVVTQIGKKYYELDSNMVANMRAFAGNIPPERITKSYARYLIGETETYSKIN